MRRLWPECRRRPIAALESGIVMPHSKISTPLRPWYLLVPLATAHRVENDADLGVGARRRRALLECGDPGATSLHPPFGQGKTKPCPYESGIVMPRPKMSIPTSASARPR